MSKQNTKNKKQQAYTNPIEAMKDVGKNIGKDTYETIKDDLLKSAPKNIMEQVFGTKPQNLSAEIKPGETLHMADVSPEKLDAEKRLKMQVIYERRLRQEEQMHVERKTGELRMQLNAVMREVVVLTSQTEKLANEAKIASMQVPVEPGVYHIAYFEKLLEFLRSFRKKIENAQVWLHTANKRASKKNYWSMYKKHGAKFLLSGEHYVSRSAG